MVSNYINYILTAVGFFGGVLAIYEFFVVRLQDLSPPKKVENIKNDDEYVVLALDESTDDENSFSSVVNSYFRQYGESDNEKFWFIHVPRGQYLIHHSKYIQFLFIGIFSIFFLLFLIGLVSFYPPDETGLINKTIPMIFSFLLLIAISIHAFFISAKSYKKRKTLESYMNFLETNNITNQMAFLQKRESYDKGLITDIDQKL